jgi:HD superfamily phosphohydrolase YqeK
MDVVYIADKLEFQDQNQNKVQDIDFGKILAGEPAEIKL